MTGAKGHKLGFSVCCTDCLHTDYSYCLWRNFAVCGEQTGPFLISGLDKDEAQIGISLADLLPNALGISSFGGAKTDKEQPIMMFPFMPIQLDLLNYIIIVIWFTTIATLYHFVTTGMSHKLQHPKKD